MSSRISSLYCERRTFRELALRGIEYLPPNKLELAGQLYWMHLVYLLPYAFLIISKSMCAVCNLHTNLEIHQSSHSIHQTRDNQVPCPGTAPLCWYAKLRQNSARWYHTKDKVFPFPARRKTIHVWVILEQKRVRAARMQKSIFVGSWSRGVSSKFVLNGFDFGSE